MKDTYLEDSVKECVDFAMSKDDNIKRDILTGLFKTINKLHNEEMLVQALNDEEKGKWVNFTLLNEITELCKRIDNAKEYIKQECFDGREYDTHGDHLSIQELLDILNDNKKQ